MLFFITKSVVYGVFYIGYWGCRVAYNIVMVDPALIMLGNII